MIEFVFTIDYEIYGDGEGSLAELVYEPARKLKQIFDTAEAKFVVFVEAAELEIIGAAKSDPAIADVEDQVRELYDQGYEIALHLHPQWYNAYINNGSWELDYSEYNLCTLPKHRIIEIVDRSIKYLRSILGASEFTPVSFRAGNWLFQPTRTAAQILAERGIKIDSSVFKGGLQHRHNLDYRPASRNGYYWRFDDDVNRSEPDGALLEIPIYTKMVPFWKMLTAKRVGLQQKSTRSRGSSGQKLKRLMDFARFRQPLKFDFCRMTMEELRGVVDTAIGEDQKSPATYKPIVAIGHTKDLVDFETIEAFLAYLKSRKIPVRTLDDSYRKCGQLKREGVAHAF